MNRLSEILREAEWRASDESLPANLAQPTIDRIREAKTVALELMKSLDRPRAQLRPILDDDADVAQVVMHRRRLARWLRLFLYRSKFISGELLVAHELLKPKLSHNMPTTLDTTTTNALSVVPASSTGAPSTFFSFSRLPLELRIVIIDMAIELRCSCYHRGVSSYKEFPDDFPSRTTFFAIHLGCQILSDHGLWQASKLTRQVIQERYDVWSKLMEIAQVNYEKSGRCLPCPPGGQYHSRDFVRLAAEMGIPVAAVALPNTIVNVSRWTPETATRGFWFNCSQSREEVFTQPALDLLVSFATHATQASNANSGPDAFAAELETQRNFYKSWLFSLRTHREHVRFETISPDELAVEIQELQERGLLDPADPINHIESIANDDTTGNSYFREISRLLAITQYSNEGEDEANEID